MYLCLDVLLSTNGQLTQTVNKFLIDGQLQFYVGYVDLLVQHHRARLNGCVTTQRTPERCEHLRVST